MNTVNEDLCILCGSCVEACLFEALRLDTALQINAQRCAGCGVCTLACTEGALVLVLRPEADQPAIPLNEQAWMEERAARRGVDLKEVI